MYLFKQNTLRDWIIVSKEINQWKEIINKYEENLKNITSSKNEDKIDLKKIQEQIKLLINHKKQYI